MAIDTTPVQISPDSIPEKVRQILDAKKTPAQRRMIVARAALPMPPEELISCLAWLTRDPDEGVRGQARSSLANLPQGTMDNLLTRQDMDRGVLDALGRNLKSVRLLGRVVVNRKTPAQTLNHLARTTNKTLLLEMLGRNQDRIANQPDLVEALYFNANTPMRVAQSVFEFAVRQGLPIQHIPGYKEIVDGLLGEDFQAAPAAAPDAEPAVEPPEEVFEEEPTITEVAAPAEEELDEPERTPEDLEDLEDFEDFDVDDEEEEEGEEEAFLRRLAQGEGLEEQDDDDGLSEFDLLLRAAAEKGEEGEEEEEDGPLGKSLNAMIDEMDVPERIRMALVGNSNARTILIHDKMKMVSSSVLDNPGLSIKEIGLYAQNRALPDELVRKICLNRDWIRHYSVKLALIQNPKTPPNMAMTFLKFMRKNDLKALSRSKDIPAIIMKMAKVQSNKVGDT